MTRLHPMLYWSQYTEKGGDLDGETGRQDRQARRGSGQGQGWRARPGEIETWRETCALRATLPAFRRRVARALDMIVEAADIGPIVVAYSGGKDSTVLLHLVRQVVPDAHAIWVDSGAELASTHEIVAHYGVTTIYPEMSLIEMCKYGGYWGHPNPVDPDAEFDFERILIHDPIAQYCDQHGIVVCAIGLRAQESTVRWITARKRGELYHAAYANRWHLCPLQRWTTDDVWAYLVGNGLAYNRAYDEMRRLGIREEQQRVGPVLGSAAAQFGRFAHLRLLDPPLYQRLVNDFPRIAIYT